MDLSKYYFWIFSSAALIVGIFIGLSSFFIFAIFLLFVAFIWLALLIDFFTDRYKYYEFRRLIFNATLGAVILSMITYQAKLFVFQYEAENIVDSLELYRDNNGIYPNSLSSLDKKYWFVKLNYSSYPEKNSYYLSYTFNGWSKKQYDTQNRYWSTND